MDLRWPRVYRRSNVGLVIDNGRVYQSKAADALVQVKTTTFGTNVGLNMLLNIISKYFGAFSGLGSCGVCHPQMAIFQSWKNYVNDAMVMFSDGRCE